MPQTTTTSPLSPTVLTAILRVPVPRTSEYPASHCSRYHCQCWAKPCLVVLPLPCCCGGGAYRKPVPCGDHTCRTSYVECLQAVRDLELSQMARKRGGDEKAEAALEVLYAGQTSLWSYNKVRAPGPALPPLRVSPTAPIYDLVVSCLTHPRLLLLLQNGVFVPTTKSPVLEHAPVKQLH